MRSNVLTVLFSVFSTLSVLSFPAAASEYEVVPVESLCPQALDKDNYTNSSLLKSLRFLTEGEDGWIYRSEADFITDFKPDATYSELRNLAKRLEKLGTRLLIVYLPTRGLMHHDTIPTDKFDHEAALKSYKEKLEKFSQLGIIVPPMTTLMEDGEGYFFKRDHHWTSEGARTTAKLVAETIRESGLVEEPANFTTTTVPAGTFTITGALAEGIKQLCGEQFINEYSNSYSTTAFFENSGDDLFSDEPKAEVVLLGTSFSALPTLNFNGFLQQELKAPVTSFAMSGGGEKGTWLKYAASGELFSSPPKIIVWELPAYYMLDDTDLFAQLKPLLAGPSDPKEPLLAREIRLDRSERPYDTLFFSDRMKNIPLSELTLDLQLSEPDINTIQFRLWYSNGKSKKEEVRIPKRANMGGHFVFSLFGELKGMESSLVAMELTGVEGQPVRDYLEKQTRKELNVQVKVYRTLHQQETGNDNERLSRQISS